MDPEEIARLQRVIGITEANQRSREEQQRLQSIQNEMAGLRQAAAEEEHREKSLPQCPACGGRLNGEFRKCRHCASDIVWVEGFPFEPAEPTALSQALEVRKKEAAAIAALKAKEADIVKVLQSTLALIQTGRCREAVTALLDGLSRHPDAGHLYSQLCLAYDQARDFAPAITAGQKAVSLLTADTDPAGRAKALNNLAISMWHNGTKGDALALLEEASRLCPNEQLYANNLQHIKNGGSPCFVVTAAMEDAQHPWVCDLRDFRDHVLRRHGFGRLLIRCYSIIGPRMADLIRLSPFLRFIARTLIVRPSVCVVRSIWGPLFPGR